MWGMPVPEFIRDLRAHIGHRPLWLSGVSGVVRDDDGRILLTRRADTGDWAVVSGVLEPGEEPARALRREIAEETGVDAEIVRLTSVDVTPPITYPNGDQTQYLDVCFLARAVGGTARVADDENTAVAWFSPDELPTPLAASSVLRIAKALDDRPEAWFAR
ncbi:NUDIX domain-containing protein [Gordonia sinesedis]